MKFKIAVIEGDGIGPEIIKEAVKVIKKIGNKFNHEFELEYGIAGGAAIDITGNTLPIETLEKCISSDSVLLGAVGGPKWDSMPSGNRPENALLNLRSKLDLFANIRPAIMYPSLIETCPLRPQIIKNGFDIVIVRELTGDVYFGEKGRKSDFWGETGYDIMSYSKKEVERIGRRGFEMAMKRKKKLCSVDKANVLETSRVWRETMHNLKKEYPEVEYSDMYVDNAAMQLIKNPTQFDVIVTGNLFGDILSDEASMITGSIGMLPSASMNETGFGMYEPIHGSAPDIAGMQIANPIASILSVAMMMRYSFNLEEEANSIENAVKKVLEKGFRTADLSKNYISTSEMTKLIIAEI